MYPRRLGGDFPMFQDQVVCTIFYIILSLLFLPMKRGVSTISLAAAPRSFSPSTITQVHHRCYWGRPIPKTSAKIAPMDDWAVDVIHQKKKLSDHSRCRNPCDLFFATKEYGTKVQKKVEGSWINLLMQVVLC